jgi:hypothetical protein
MNVVVKSLFSFYRLIGLGFWGVIVLVVVVASVVTARFSGIELSVWELVTGQASKYWLLILGISVVATHLKLFVANGVTRHDYLLGAGVFCLATAVAFAALVPIGRGVERLLRSAFGATGNGYPDYSAGEAVSDFGHYAPGALGWLITGALIAAGFYRYSWWAGLLLIIPFALPLVIPETLLGLYVAPDIAEDRFVPFGVGLALSLLASAAGAIVLRLVMRDVPIKASAG